MLMDAMLSLSGSCRPCPGPCLLSQPGAVTAKMSNLSVLSKLLEKVVGHQIKGRLSRKRRFLSHGPRHLSIMYYCLRQGCYVMPGVCLSACLSVCLTVSNFT